MLLKNLHDLLRLEKEVQTLHVNVLEVWVRYLLIIEMLRYKLDYLRYKPWLVMIRNETPFICILGPFLLCFIQRLVAALESTEYFKGDFYESLG